MVVSVIMMPEALRRRIAGGALAQGDGVAIDSRIAALVALGLLAIGPFVLRHILFGQQYSYGRVGLALIGVGMGLHLISGALNQAALARDKARAAAGCWLVAAAVFVVWMVIPAISDQVLRVEIGYAGATALLAAALGALYRRGGQPVTAPR